MLDRGRGLWHKIGLSMKKITLLDGGLGRELERSGAPFRRPEWSALALMEGPEYVTNAHRAFADSGADVITTNTYAIVPFHIGEARFTHDGKRLTALAAQLARDVANPRDLLTAGCLPPVFGSYRPDLFDAARAPNIYDVLIQQQADYVDFWLAETIGCTREAAIIVERARAIAPKPIWLAFTLADDLDDENGVPRLRSGESVEQALHLAEQMGADALLFNCSQMERMAPALQIISAAKPALRFGAYANNFEPVAGSVEVNSETVSLRKDVTTEDYVSAVQEWLDLGATIVGGCCGIGPEHIAAIRTLIDARKV